MVSFPPWRAADPASVQILNSRFAVTGSIWALVAMFMAYIPFGLLPHIGNKLWALNDESERRRFISIAFIAALAFPLISLGGLLARVVLGDQLLGSDGDANSAIPALFIELFPPWMAAVLGTAILASIMSTADGLVISSSQVFANDLYRRTVVPRWFPQLAPPIVEERVLWISRIGIVLTMIVATVLAWFTVHMNIVLLTWVGLGAMIAALSGSLILGLFWRGLTRPGAVAGFVTGAGVFIALHAHLLDATTEYLTAPWWQWVLAQGGNPYACAALGEMVSVAMAVLVSFATPKLPQAHLDRVFLQTER